MTEADLAELVSIYGSQGASMVALWITVLSAYLVAGFLVDDKFSSSQILILNCLYIGSVVRAIYATFGTLNSQAFYVSKLKELDPESPQMAGEWAARGISMLLALGTLASLKFMWDIRHTRIE